MKKIIILFCVFASHSLDVSAQLGNLANKVKNKLNAKVNQRIDNKVDAKINQSLDAVEGKTTATASPASESVNENNSDNSIKSTGKYDFVPGEQILYADNFSNDE